MGATATGRVIVAQGDLSPNRHKEYAAAAALKPGHLIKLDSSSRVLKHATQGGAARRLFAKENGIVGDITTTAYVGYDTAPTAPDIVPCHDAQPGDLINWRVAAGAASITLGDFLTSAGDGTAKKTGATSELQYSQVADSSTITNTSGFSAFDVSYTVPAGLLAAGDLIRVSGHVLCTVKSATADVLIVTVKLGSTSVLVSGTINAQANDICYFQVDIKIRTIGNSGTFVAGGYTLAGTPSAAASAGDIPSPYNVTSTAINTNTTNAITVGPSWGSSTNTNTTLMKDFNVELVRASAGNDAVLAVAEETYDNSAGTDEAFVLARII